VASFLQLFLLNKEKVGRFPFTKVGLKNVPTVFKEF
jgi:hypothetical protein